MAFDKLFSDQPASGIDTQSIASDSSTVTYGRGNYPYLSFAGCDIKLLATVRPYMHERQQFDGTTQKVLADVETLSISTFRERMPVRNLGNVRAKAYTGGGPRTLAGSMIFVMFDQEVFYEFLKYNVKDVERAGQYAFTNIDQIPPMDIFISMANEYGYQSRQFLRGVQVVSSAQVMSIQDLYTEKTVQFVATDVTPLEPMTNPYQERYNAVEYQQYKTLDNIVNTDPEINRIYRKLRDPFK